MDAVQWIVAWGAVAALAGAVGGTTAQIKNRDVSSWIAWCLVLPPLVLVLLWLPKREAPAPQRPSPDEEGRD